MIEKILRVIRTWEERLYCYCFHFQHEETKRKALGRAKTGERHTLEKDFFLEEQPHEPGGEGRTLEKDFFFKRTTA